MNRPWLTFDPDGAPRVHIPLANGGDMSVACTPAGLVEFIGEAKQAINERADDPKLQASIGKALLGIAGRWFK